MTLQIMAGRYAGINPAPAPVFDSYLGVWRQDVGEWWPTAAADLSGYPGFGNVESTITFFGIPFSGIALPLHMGADALWWATITIQIVPTTTSGEVWTASVGAGSIGGGTGPSGGAVTSYTVPQAWSPYGPGFPVDPGQFGNEVGGPTTVSMSTFGHQISEGIQTVVELGPVVSVYGHPFTVVYMDLAVMMVMDGDLIEVPQAPSTIASGLTNSGVSGR